MQNRNARRIVAKIVGSVRGKTGPGKRKEFRGQGHFEEHSTAMKGILGILVAPAGQRPRETPYHTEDPPAQHLAEDITYGSNRALGH